MNPPQPQPAHRAKAGNGLPASAGISANVQLRKKQQPILPKQAQLYPVANESQEIIVSVLAKTRSSWSAESERYLPLESVIGVGFGYAALTRDGKPMFEENGQDFEQLMTVAEAERMAQADPHRDWQIHLVALLDERHYRRMNDGRWTLIQRGYGLS